MNSLQQLNHYSQLGVPFTDDRPFTISFSANTATNSNVSIYENQKHTTIPGIDIVSVRSVPRPITFSVNVANAPGATIQWANVAVGSGFTFSNANGVFTASGINGVNAWNQIKYANVIMPLKWESDWSYTSTITYPNTANVTLSNTISWTTNVNVKILNQLTQSNMYAYYPVTGNASIPNSERLIDISYSDFSQNNYTLVVTANNTSAIRTLSTSGPNGVTSTYSNTTGNLTLNGTLTNINNHLANLTVWSADTVPWKLTYSLTNPASNFKSNAVQEVRSVASLQHLTPTNIYYYQANVANNVEYTPTITVDNDYGYNGNLTLTVTPNSTSGITSLSSTGSFATSSFNNSTKVLTIFGNVVGVNNHLANVTYDPVDQYANLWIATYSINSGTPFESNVTQTIRSGDLRYLGAITPAYYDKNNPFDPASPVITDVESDTNGIFTVNVYPTSSNSISYIYTDASTNHEADTPWLANVVYTSSAKSLSITGTKGFVNDLLGKIYIFPGTDITNNFILNYKLTRPNSSTVTKSKEIVWSGVDTLTTNLDVSRSYVSNTAANNIFYDSPPQIRQQPYNTTYKVALTTSSGILDTPYIGLSYPQGTMSGNLILIGDSSSINAQLDQRIYYYPPADTTATQTVRYRQWRNNVLQIDSNISLTGSARTAGFADSATLIFATVGNTSQALTYEQAFYMKAKATVIAGGGGGGNDNGSSYYGGNGGGGGGQFVEQSNIRIGSTTMFVGVGGGGASFQVGGSSYIKKTDNTSVITAAGGGLGSYNGGRTGGTGGNYGGLSYRSAGGSNYYNNYGGGGGGGSGATASGANGGDGSIAPAAYPAGGGGGGGGAGKTSTLHPTQLPLVYSSGGGGGAGSGIQQYTVLGGAGGPGAGTGGYYNYTTSSNVPPTSATRYGCGGGGAGGSFNNNGGNGFSGIVVVTFY